MSKNKIPAKVILIISSVFILLTAAGRVTSYFYTVCATDVAYPEWISTLLSFVSDAFVSLRLSLAFALAIHSAMSSLKFSLTLLSSVFVFLDYVARFLIDMSAGAIVEREAFAAVWLILNFVWELVFVLCAYFIAGYMKKKLNRAETDSAYLRKKYSPAKALLYSTLLFLISRLISEFVYLADFLLTYTNITSAEIASIIASFLRVIVICGGVLYIGGSVSLSLLPEKAHK